MRRLTVSMMFMLGLCLLAVPAAAQETPTEVFFSREGNFSFLYPEGWTVEDLELGILMSDPQVTLIVVFVGPELVNLASRGAADPDKALERTLQVLEFTVDGEYDFGEVGGREAVFVGISSQTQSGYAGVIAFEEGGWGLMAVTGEDRLLRANRELLDTIFASFNSGQRTPDTDTPPRTDTRANEQTRADINGAVGRARTTGLGALGSAAPGESFDAPDEDNTAAPPETAVTCIVTASRPAIRRSEPSATGANRGTLSGGSSEPAFAQATDGRLVWYQLGDGSWVRSDVVVEEGDCDALPQGG